MYLPIRLRDFALRIPCPSFIKIKGMTPSKCCKFVHNPMRGFENVFRAMTSCVIPTEALQVLVGC